LATDFYYGTGKRKTSTARVFLYPGNGQIKINERDTAHYFFRDSLRVILQQPLVVTENADKFDVIANVHGGGLSGQAGAIQLGISRALLTFNPELRSRLKRAGFLRRDPRAKERKKYGQPGARKRFQFSKR
jgi:small subunit ribosomal protein S9